MTTIDEVKQLQIQGKSDSEIMRVLQSKGLSATEINQAISQSKIREAVTSPETEFSQDISQNQEMQPSMMGVQEEQEYSQEPQQETSQEEYPQQQQYYNQQYTPYQSSISADTIAEISEQVVAEKLSQIKKAIEKAIETKADYESRISTLEERLKRIESIIDRLQLAILQKVGEYITNTEDIKKEIQEMQKTFKSTHKK